MTTTYPAQAGESGASGAGRSLRPHVPTALVEHLLAQVVGKGGGTETTLAPFTGEELITYPIASEQDVEAAFERARVAQRAWAARPVAERARIVGRIHNLALARQAEILDLLQLEGGKARYDAFQEALGVPIYARYNARSAAKALKPSRRRGVLPGGTKATELHHPRGVVGLITAWNYPAVFAASDGFAALVGGNAIVHRPDTQTALSAIWVRSLAIEAGVPDDVWQIVLGAGRVIGTAIVDRADAVAFTGSTQAGREIAARTGRRLIYTSLELGGKNPFIVLPDANIERAVDAAVRCCFVNSGQTCVGPERLLVAREVYDEFRDRLVERLERLKVGGELSFAAEMGSLVDAKQFASVCRQVEDAVAHGATVLAGGRPLPEVGPYFFAPTLLEGVTREMTLCDEETFGPVVALYPFDSLDEAIELANDTEYGLHAVVWTGSSRQGERVAARIHAGTVEINDGIVATWASADLPQGGMKASGMGRRNGEHGILRFTETQSVVVSRGMPLAPPKQLTQERYAKVMNATTKLLHRLPRP